LAPTRDWPAMTDTISDFSLPYLDKRQPRRFPSFPSSRTAREICGPARTVGGSSDLSRPRRPLFSIIPLRNRRKAWGGNIVLALQEDESGNMWVGTRYDGLLRLNRPTGIFSKVKLGPEVETIWSLYLDREGLLWVGTQGSGLYRLNPATEESTNFRHDPNDPRSLGSDTVWSIPRTAKEPCGWEQTRGDSTDMSMLWEALSGIGVIEAGLMISSRSAARLSEKIIPADCGWEQISAD
jgi:hypothetical protein